MGRNSAAGKWVRFSSTEYDVEEREQEEEEEEALSLCDLPIYEDDRSRKEAPQAIKTQDDFDFCSLLKESEMCSADEVFFQGQILPLRHSVSSETSLAALRSHSHNMTSRCFSRSESMEHCYSSGFTSGSSRSSSIRSHQSTSSGSSSTTTPIHKPRVHNQFHSHPSPRPQIKFSNNRNQNVANCNKSSPMWSHFRLGLLTTPEIALQDLKVRSISNNNTKRFGSHNSSSSSSNSSSSKTTKIKSDMRKKHGIFDKNGALFGGCKCSINAVETVPSRVVTIRRSASLNKAYSHEEEEMVQLAIKGTKEQHAGKQSLSRHRTFEWLKQLSLESSSATDDA